MDPERWQQIDELFGAALELGPEERALAIWERQPGAAGTEDVPASFAAFLRAHRRGTEAAELEARAAAALTGEGA